ncbi:MAG: hypothetical protein ACFE95_04410 [Candidatus Hodarchaeota archaeon]
MSKLGHANNKNEIDRILTYLERKYGREPKITREELLRIRFAWH